MRKLTNTDLHIIRLLQENARMPIVDIAKEVSLSRTSVKNRIEQLAEEGFIGKFTVTVSPKTFEKNIAFFIKISDLKVSTQDFRHVIEHFPALTEVYSITGNGNYIGKGYVRDTDEMNQLLEQLMKYGNIHTSLILEQIIDRNLKK